jgi:hypothetical protein
VERNPVDSARPGQPEAGSCAEGQAEHPIDETVRDFAEGQADRPVEERGDFAEGQAHDGDAEREVEGDFAEGQREDT